ncbi:hypothetical protein M3D92_02430 [Micrococcus terreus]|uniref:hypothetical protein n=1 Tax=Micrococcus terreus TaxID=574650 RepID=UPI0021A888A2|nr:hypothetical protein [Micrococcus terreus]MCT2088156.1 hypothetical protein [Micrococcus terreus]MDK7700794.1 hypothetical protein [Micrococcus terreus]WOO96954.1 hypothetical protein R3I42_10540 [Micrococcus terreus]
METSRQSRGSCTLLPAALMVGGLVLSACSAPSTGTGPTTAPSSAATLPSASVTPSPTAPTPSETARAFGSVEELYEAVDQELGCPVNETGDHFTFMLESSPVVGRDCGAGILMAWSEDPEQIREIAQQMQNTEGPTAAAQAVHWIVVDVTEVPSRAESDLPRADSEDVATLAETLDATYIE